MNNNAAYMNGNGGGGQNRPPLQPYAPRGLVYGQIPYAQQFPYQMYSQVPPYQQQQQRNSWLKSPNNFNGGYQQRGGRFPHQYHNYNQYHSHNQYHNHNQQRYYQQSQMQQQQQQQQQQTQSSQGNQFNLESKPFVSKKQGNETSVMTPSDPNDPSFDPSLEMQQQQQQQQVEEEVQDQSGGGGDNGEPNQTEQNKATIEEKLAAPSTFDSNSEPFIPSSIHNYHQKQSENDDNTNNNEQSQSDNNNIESNQPKSEKLIIEKISYQKTFDSNSRSFIPPSAHYHHHHHQQYHRQDMYNQNGDNGEPKQFESKRTTIEVRLSAPSTFDSNSAPFIPSYVKQNAKNASQNEPLNKSEPAIQTQEEPAPKNEKEERKEEVKEKVKEEVKEEEKEAEGGEKGANITEPPAQEQPKNDTKAEEQPESDVKTEEQPENDTKVEEQPESDTKAEEQQKDTQKDTVPSRSSSPEDENAPKNEQESIKDTPTVTEESQENQENQEKKEEEKAFDEEKALSVTPVPAVNVSTPSPVSTPETKSESSALYVAPKNAPKIRKLEIVRKNDKTKSEKEDETPGKKSEIKELCIIKRDNRSASKEEDEPPKANEQQTEEPEKEEVVKLDIKMKNEETKEKKVMEEEEEVEVAEPESEEECAMKEVKKVTKYTRRELLNLKDAAFPYPSREMYILFRRFFPNVEIEPPPHDKVILYVQQILNKIVPNNCDKLMKELSVIDVSSSQLLNDLVTMIFNKAVSERGRAEMYAKICKYLSDNLKLEKIPPITSRKDGKPVPTDDMFRRVVLRTCESNYCKEEWRKFANEPPKGLTKNEEDSYMNRRFTSYTRFKGNFEFLSELFLIGMVSHKTIHNIIRDLLSNVTKPVLEYIEPLKIIFEKAGKKLYARPAAEPCFRAYIARIKAMTELPPEILPPRYRFFLLDILDLNKRKWTAAPPPVASPVLSDPVRRGRSPAVASSPKASRGPNVPLLLEKHRKRVFATVEEFFELRDAGEALECVKEDIKEQREREAFLPLAFEWTFVHGKVLDTQYPLLIDVMKRGFDEGVFTRENFRYGLRSLFNFVLTEDFVSDLSPAFTKVMGVLCAKLVEWDTARQSEVRDYIRVLSSKEELSGHAKKILVAFEEKNRK